MRTGSIFQPRPYPKTIAFRFTTICSAFISESFRSLWKRLVQEQWKQYGGNQGHKEISGCSLTSQSTSSEMIKRLGRRLHLQLKPFNKLFAFCIASYLSEIKN